MQQQVPVSRLNSDLFNQRISAGVNHALAIIQQDNNNEMPYILSGWGSPEFLALGEPRINGMEIRKTPEIIALKYLDKEYVPIQVAVGDAHSMIIGYPKDNFPGLVSIDNSNTQYNPFDQLMKDKNSQNLRLFSAGSDQFGQQGRQTKQEQENENDEGESKAEEEDDDLDDENEEAQQAKFLINTIVDLQSIIQVACGSNYTIALDIYGTIFSWGDGSTGVLGNGNTTKVDKPTKIHPDNLRSYKYIAAGPSHAGAISMTGQLFLWGSGSKGQLGNGYKNSANSPVQAEGSLNGKIIEQFSCGSLHTAVISSDGYAHTFGYNKNGQLGQNDYNDREWPTKMLGIQNYFAMYCKCGGNTTFIGTYERYIFAMGSNQKGRLGFPDIDANVNEPKSIRLCDFTKKKDGFIYQMSLSFHYGLALTEYGELVSFGLPYKGCLGRDLQKQQMPGFVQQQLDEILGDDDDEDDNEKNKEKIQALFKVLKPDVLQQLIQPMQLERLFVMMRNKELSDRLSSVIQQSQQLVQVLCGAFHSVGLTDVGELWVWGSNDCNQHGMSTAKVLEEVTLYEKHLKVTSKQKIQKECLPTMVPLFRVRENKKVTYLATGFEYLVIVENRRNIYAWGKNNKGQCGLGFVSDTIEIPTKLEDLEGQLIKMVACGEDHTILLNDDGICMGFGSPTDGKLGIGQKNAFVLQAVKLPELCNVQKICVGPYHSMALTIDPFAHERKIAIANKNPELDTKAKYVIYTWGNGYGGKLGHGNMENQYYPKLLQTKYTFIDISAGTNHSAAISSDNQIIVWGIGAYLQLQKPEDVTGNDIKKAKGNKNQIAKPYFIMSPIQQEDFIKKYICVQVFDKMNLVLTNNMQIQQWGKFDRQFQKELGDNVQEDQREIMLDRILVQVITTQELGINFTKISCSFNHAIAIGEVEIQTEGKGDKKKKLDIYSWGNDGMTGRLGLGYEFVDPEKDNDIQIGKKIQREVISDIEQEIVKPQQLTFIQQYLDFKFQEEQAAKKKQQEAMEREEEEEEQQNEQISTTPQKGVDKFQLNTNRVKIADRVYLAKKHLSNQPQLIYKLSAEQFILQQQPDIYTFAKPDTSKVKQNMFGEKVVDDIYEEAYSLMQTNEKLFRDIQHVHLKGFKDFKKEAMLNIINKIQKSPFNIKFNKKDDKESKIKVDIKFEQFKANEHQYTILFSLLQMHPCYLFNIYKHNLMTRDEFIALVVDVYGDVEGDKRKYRLYINLIILILEHDLPKYMSKNKETILSFSAKSEESDPLYTFTQLFIKFYESFSGTIAFSNFFVFHSSKWISDKIYSGQKVPKPLKNFALVYLPDDVRKEKEKQNIRFEDSAQPKLFSERVEFINDQFQDIFKQLFDDKSKQFQRIPQPVRQLFIRSFDVIRPLYQNVNVDLIQNRLLGLFFIHPLISFRKVVKIQEKLSKEKKLNESKTKNVKCFIRLFTEYINGNKVKEDYQWINALTDMITSNESTTNRRKLFTYITIEQKMQNQKIQKKQYSEVMQILDMYRHSIQYNDDIIRPTIQVIQSVTKCVVANISNIRYIRAENQDLINLFVSKLDACNYNAKPAEPEELNERVLIKLYSRQLFHSKKSLSIKQCSFCRCFLVESFMQSSDDYHLQRFNQWNSASLPALLIASLPYLGSKTEFDNFISGSQASVGNFLKQKIKIQKEAGEIGNALKLQEFEKAFNEKIQFNLLQSDDINKDSPEKLRQENRLLLKELKKQIDQQLVQILLYVHVMERNMKVLDAINNLLVSTIQNYQSTKIVTYHQILSNCYYGMANKEIIHTLQHDPTALVGKIKDAIKKVSTSQEIYENIDIFKKDIDTPSTLQIFGSYSYELFKNRTIIEDKIDNQLLQVIQKQTRQQITSQVICERLIFIIQKRSNIEIIMLYSELVMNCCSFGTMNAAFEPIEFIVDEFEIATSAILQMRKSDIENTKEQKKRKFGKFMYFYEKGLLDLIDQLLNHAVIYDHIFVEPSKNK